MGLYGLIGNLPGNSSNLNQGYARDPMLDELYYLQQQQQRNNPYYAALAQSQALNSKQPGSYLEKEPNRERTFREELQEETDEWLKNA